MADENMRVFIVDNNVAWRDAIGALLDQQADMKVIGKCPLNPRTLSQLTAARPDVLLLGHDTWSDELQERICQLRQDLPDMAIIIHGRLGQVTCANVMEAGAAAYLPKGSSPSTILKTIRDARYDLDVVTSNSTT
jgi:DNA-binding NarL/FixJ family response regulator